MNCANNGADQIGEKLKKWHIFGARHDKRGQELLLVQCAYTKEMPARRSDLAMSP